jgi:hypothetical protein
MYDIQAMAKYTLPNLPPYITDKIILDAAASPVSNFSTESRFCTNHIQYTMLNLHLGGPSAPPQHLTLKKDGDKTFLSWMAPESNGGANIANYLLQYK